MTHPVTEAAELLRQEAGKWDDAPLVVRVRAARLRLAADRLDHWMADRGESSEGRGALPSSEVIVAELRGFWDVEVSGFEVFVDGKPLRQAGLYEPFAFLAQRCARRAAEIASLRVALARAEGATSNLETSP